MKRIEQVWFEFKGVANTQLGVDLLSMPVRRHPAERGEQVTIPGRDGYLWLPEGGYQNTILPVQCFVQDIGCIDEVNQWLSGAGDLLFSDEPNRVYRARVTKEFTRTNKLARFSAQEFTVTFDCQPFRYLYPAAADIIVAGSGATVSNPGTYKSEPRLRIEFTGEASVTVGGSVMEFDAAPGNGLIVDSEWMDVLRLDGRTLANQYADIAVFPTLGVGPNVISWEGNVTKVTVTPRWRFL